MNERVEKVKEVIAKYFNQADCGIFNSRNNVGDTLFIVYDEDGVEISVCGDWSYFEVLGLTDEEFAEVYCFYNELQKGGIE